MTQAHYHSVCFLLLAGGACAASLPAAPPPQQVGPAAVAQPAAAASYQCLNPSGQLHRLLRQYALKCGNPACPLCYPAAPPP
ncbi:hypothetical protein DFR38_10663 [Aquitalea magnusonii]|uniref:Uncharacterized protein n=1 Tax=Aquitalea magnusonii TaxID=332411 RepID=A0A318JF56_9NEIS|nr:hypothetical protein DFR38_10663 [Aquitalea magnusonii]